MGVIYPYVQVVHLLCAIIFVGHLFFDVITYSFAAKKMPHETALAAQKAYESIASKFMPWIVFTIILTGGMMMTRWVNSDIGYFSTNMQKLFMLKVLLGSLIFLAILINKINKNIFKKSTPLINIHPFALPLALIIILIAKSFIYIG
ncbi:MAG: copper resistance protein CopD [Campylobacter sp.]|nr:copper resistance protein CopD [Campylobacter sp.]